MKKTYITPAALTVALGTCKMMAQSLTIYNSSGGPTIGNSSSILTKEENTTTDVNVWDEEW